MQRRKAQLKGNQTNEATIHPTNNVNEDRIQSTTAEQQ